MKKKVICMVLLVIAFAVVCIAATQCKQTESKKSDRKEESIESVKDSDEETIEPTEDEIPISAGTESGITDTPDVDEEVAETQKTNSQGSTTSSSSSNTSDMSAQTHIHDWVARAQLVTHQAAGHYETKVVETVYAWRTFCNKCGKDITDLGAEGITIHSAVLCESGYHNDYVVVESKTEQVWVEDTPARTEIVINGYECSCGATK